MNGGTVLRALLLLVALAGVLAAAGCGGSDETTTVTVTTTVSAEEAGESEESEEGEEEEEESTPEEALAEVRAIPALLDEAVALYVAGDQAAAADAVGDIYLEHYEHVEGPLGDRNHDLMEEIEEQIATELRSEMEEGAPQDDIDSLVSEIKENLTEAEGELS